METKYMRLTDMEKKTILSLANNGPLAGYDFHLQGKRERGGRKAIMSSGEWTKIQKRLGPEDLNLIQPVILRGKPKATSSRRRKPFWLTGIGVAVALLLGAKTDVISSHIRDNFFESEEMRLILSITKVLGKKSLELALQMVLSYPLEEAISKISVIALLEPRKYTSKSAEVLIKEFENALKPYPKYHKLYEDSWKGICKLSRMVEKKGVES